MMPILFYAFSSVAVTCATMVIRAKNPVHSVLFLILVFCNVAGLMLLVDLDFFAMIFLVVYVGAIAVLFLFVVMMLDIRLAELQENALRYLPIGGLITCIFFLEVFVILDQDLMPLLGHHQSAQLYTWSDLNVSTIEALGQVLYTTYVYDFILASFILLVAMIGAIVVTMQKGIHVKKQEVYEQNLRESGRTIHKVRDNPSSPSPL
jgi:NADH:ubiquinone oxidoreductase subunit 6 (subunit J)